MSVKFFTKDLTYPGDELLKANYSRGSRLSLATLTNKVSKLKDMFLSLGIEYDLKSEKLGQLSYIFLPTNSPKRFEILMLRR